MRNRYPGICYKCGKTVRVGDGFFEKVLGGWSVHHAEKDGRCFIPKRMNIREK